jgi:hypothetical protein
LNSFVYNFVYRLALARARSIQLPLEWKAIDHHQKSRNLGRAALKLTANQSIHQSINPFHAFYKTTIFSQRELTLFSQQQQQQQQQQLYRVWNHLFVWVVG